MCCVPTFMAKTPILNNFMRENDKKMLKKPQKCNFTRNFKHMNIVFDSYHFNTINYTK